VGHVGVIENRRLAMADLTDKLSAAASDLAEARAEIDRLAAVLDVGGSDRCRVRVLGCTHVATHDLGPFGGSRRSIPACLSCVRAHDAEGTQYGRARPPRSKGPQP
jgi:hypothetical protein